jgi:putative addiction module antidote
MDIIIFALPTSFPFLSLISVTHTTIKIRQVGSSAGAIFPKEILEELHARIGDTLHLVRTERGFEITAFDPAFEQAMEAYREVALEYRAALRELSK